MQAVVWRLSGLSFREFKQRVRSLGGVKNCCLTTLEFRPISGGGGSGAQWAVREMFEDVIGGAALDVPL